MPSTMEPNENIPFFDDKSLNTDFNADFWQQCKGLDADGIRVMKNLVLDYQTLVPRWDYNTAMQVLNIAAMQVQHSKLLNKITSGKKIARHDTDMIGSLLNSLEKAKKDIGIDPKSLASKGGGSMSETFIDYVRRNCKFQAKRFAFKPMAGAAAKARVQDSEIDALEAKSEKEIEDYLLTAAAE